MNQETDHESLKQNFEAYSKDQLFKIRTDLVERKENVKRHTTKL